MKQPPFYHSIISTAIESITDNFLYLDNDFRIVFINIKGAQFLGKSREEIIGKKLFELFPQLKKTFAYEKLLEAQETQESVEYSNYNPDAAAWFKVRLYPSVDGIALYAIDITETKSVEERFNIEKEQMSFALKAANIGTFEWNIRTGFVVWAPELDVLYGLHPGEFKGGLADWEAMLHPDDKHRIWEKVLETIRQKKELDIEFRVVWPDKSIHWIYAKGVTTYKDGKPEKMIGINMDITARKEAERQKDEFISIASHELRTPVTTIKGFAQIMLMQFGGNEKLNYFLTKMNSQVDRLSNLINDLLDVSRMQSGRLILNKEETAIDQLILDIVEDVQQTTSHHRIECELSARVMVDVDKYRFSQVIINLLSNAIKYSPQANRVLVKSHVKRGNVVVSVEDFGIGISRRDQKKVFEPFYQARNTIRQSYSGLGLGLHIADEIIQKHGGTIEVESTKGKGSIFSFTIPYKTIRKEHYERKSVGM